MTTSRHTLIVLLLLALTGLAGCMGANQQELYIRQYMLEYPAMEPGEFKPLSEGIKLTYFTAADSILSTEMVFRPSPYQREVYTYHRWRIEPARLVEAMVVRDMRASGLFNVVLDSFSRQRTRFRLEGGITQFIQDDSNGASLALVSATFTLIDDKSEDRTKRVVFQREYTAEAPLAKPNAESFAAAASLAVAEISSQLVLEAYAAAGIAMEGCDSCKRAKREAQEQAGD